MNTAQRILKNFLSLLSAGIVTSLLSFVAIIYLARVLGPGDFGKINFAIAIVVYLTLIANLGLPLLGTREIARKREKIRDYLGSIVTLRLCLALFGFGLLLLMAFLLNKPLEIKYLIILYGLGIIPSALTPDWAFQGVEKMEYIGIGHILASGIYLGLVLWFVKSSKQLLLVPCFQVVGNLLAAGLLLSILVKNFGKPKFRFNLIFWRSLIRQSIPIGFTLIMIRIYYGVDTIMLGFMKSDKDVGYYNAAYKIIMLLFLVIGAYCSAIYPVISNYYKTSLNSLKQLLEITTKLMISALLPLAIGGTIIAKSIMRLLYGAGYDNGIVALQILLWVLAIMSINVAQAWGLLGCDRQKQFLMGAVAITLSNIILNFMLIPPFGLIGAAIATVSAEGIACVIYRIQFQKIIKIPFAKPVLKSLFASSIMGLFLYWGLNNLNLNVFVLIFGGMFIYTMFFYLTKGITKEEVDMIKSVIFSKSR